MTSENRIKVNDDELDLNVLFRKIKNGIKYIIITSFIFLVCGAIYSVSKVKVYSSSTLLTSNFGDEASSLNGLIGQFGGLASIAGLDLNSGGANKTDVALEILKSRVFIKKFIEDNGIMPEILASKEWNEENNTLVFDSIYDESTKEWKEAGIFTSKLTLNDAYESFVSNNLNVSKDQDSGFIKVSVQHHSPILAKKWLEFLISEINEEMRLKDREKSEVSLLYLNRQLDKSKIAEHKTLIYNLIEEQTKQEMLTHLSEDYAFRIIDPPYLPEKPVGPGVVIHSLLFMLLGFIVSIFFILFRKEVN